MFVALPIGVYVEHFVRVQGVNESEEIYFAWGHKFISSVRLKANGVKPSN